MQSVWKHIWSFCGVFLFLNCLLAPCMHTHARIHKYAPPPSLYSLFILNIGLKSLTCGTQISVRPDQLPPLLLIFLAFLCWFPIFTSHGWGLPSAVGYFLAFSSSLSVWTSKAVSEARSGILWRCPNHLSLISFIWDWFHLHCSRIPPRQHAKLERVDFINHLLTLKNVTLQRCGYLYTM